MKDQPDKSLCLLVQQHSKYQVISHTSDSVLTPHLKYGLETPTFR